MEGLSVLDMIQSGWISTYPLIIFSIVTVSIICERAWSLRNVTSQTLQLSGRICPSLEQGDVNAALDTLTAREKLVLQLRFGLGHSHQHTLAEVGEQLQISRERVRQIENEALQKLRKLDGDRLFAYHQEL